jgi:Dolichyl-phosphate-mannose-protein mannosyltransferase
MTPEAFAEERSSAEGTATTRPSASAPATTPRFSVLVPLAIYASSRVAVGLVALAATWLQPQLTVAQVLAGWDGGWYLRIAADGYPGSLVTEGGGNRWAFFPLLPGLVRLVAQVPGLTYRDAGLVVALVLGALAAVAVWCAVARLFSRELAGAVTLLLCFFPTAYAFSMIYTEGLFIAAAAGTLLLLGQRRWVLAGLVAGAGCLSRSVGAVLVLVCLVEAVAVVRAERRMRPLFAPALAALAGASWAVVSWVRVGSATAFTKAQETWGPGFVWFRTPFRSALHLVTRRSAWSNAQEVMAAGALVFMAVGVALLVWLHRRGERLPLSWWVYIGGTVLAALSPFWPSSVLRYSMAVFPLFIGYCRLVPRRHLPTVAAVSATLMGGLALVAFASIATWQTAPFAP